MYSHELVWELWNVLVQLAFTILIAYAIMQLPNKTQIGISMGLLLLTEVLYRAYNPGAPYAQGHDSFGSFVDQLVMGQVNDGYWVFVNFIPTAAHTIWGVVCGKLLLEHLPEKEKIKQFVIWGSIILVFGFALDILGITPIVKRIATTSFTLASGGFAILTLAFFYWAIDVRDHQPKWLKIFSVVGTNSIFYLFICRNRGCTMVQGVWQNMGQRTFSSFGSARTCHNGLEFTCGTLYLLVHYLLFRPTQNLF
ncbi:hypothetical protein Q2T40_21285 [Winogradskyella maritima]|nr:hypothetical protein [Winogradskyella maritima]